MSRHLRDRARPSALAATSEFRQQPTPRLSILEATGVTKSFGATEVLRGIDVSIPAGTSTAIVGPSGSGKSTLLAVLGLLTARDGGNLRVLDHEIGLRASARTTLAVRRRMAWLPQLPLTLPGRTCLDNALAGIRARSEVRPADVEFARALFEQLGVGGLPNRDVSVLSGGELQKVALIRCLVVRPDLILADEPTASLDSSSTAAVIGALAEAARLSTLVIASHDPAVTEICDTVVSIRDGQISAVE